MAILIFTPINSELKFLFLHMLPSIYRHMLVISILTVVKWQLKVVLICMSLMITDTAHRLK